MLFLRKREKKCNVFMLLAALNVPPVGSFAGNALKEFTTHNLRRIYGKCVLSPPPTPLLPFSSPLSSPACASAVVDCGPPDPPKLGTYRLMSNRTSFGATVAYECDDNWKVEFRARRFCQDNSTWSGPTPNCIRKNLSFTHHLHII